MAFEYKKLRGRIVEKFGTQGEFAKALEVSENTVSRKMNMAIGFSTEDIVKWSELLDIAKEDIGDYFFA